MPGINTEVTRGKQIGNNDNKTLMEYYYTFSECIVALVQLSYTSDLFSSDILQQVIVDYLQSFMANGQNFAVT